MLSISLRKCFYDFVRIWEYIILTNMENIHQYRIIWLEHLHIIDDTAFANSFEIQIEKAFRTN